MKPSYKRLANKLLRTLNKLPCPVAPVGDMGQMAAWLDGVPFSQVRKVDAALRHYSESGELPHLEYPAMAEIRLRFEFALALCQSAGDSPHADVLGSEACALRFLLVMCWHGRGPEWVRERYPASSSVSSVDISQDAPTQSAPTPWLDLVQLGESSQSEDDF